MAIGYSGLASGLQSGLEIGRRMRAQEQKRERLEQEQQAAKRQQLIEGVNSEIADMREEYTEVMTNLVERGIDPRSEKGQKITQAYKRRVRGLLDDPNIKKLPLATNADREAQWYEFQGQSIPSRMEKMQGEISKAKREAAATTEVEERIKSKYEKPERGESTVDVVLDDGTVMRPKAQIIDGKLQIATETGEYKPPNQVYGNIREIRRPAEEGGTGTGEADPSTISREDFMPESGEIGRASYEAGVGPIDAAQRVLAKTPILGQILRSDLLGGESFGKEQTIADQSMTALRSEVVTAFAPGEGKTSNFDLQTVMPLVPTYGAFGTDESTKVQLEELRQKASDQLDTQIERLRNPNLYSEKQLEAARAQADASAKLVAQTEALLKAAEEPAIKINQKLGGVSPEEASNDQIVDALGDLDQESATQMLNSLSQERRNEIYSRIQGGQ